MQTSKANVAHANPHLEALRSKHAALSFRIEQEQKHAAPSEHMLRALKSQKLRLKDEIEAAGG